jgi:hypothetical protein
LGRRVDKVGKKEVGWRGVNDKEKNTCQYSNESTGPWEVREFTNQLSDHQFVKKDSPSKLTQAAILLMWIREVPVSNLCWDTDYTDWRFCGFYRSLPADADIIPSHSDSFHFSIHY